MSHVLIDFARATDDVPCRIRILFIWLDLTCADGGWVDGACDLVSLILIIAFFVSV